MKIVVTGGTGRIGEPFVKSLAEGGHEVIVLTRGPKKHAGTFPQGNVTLVQWDAKTVGEWAAHLEGADAVVHLAGEDISGGQFPPKRWTDARKQAIYDGHIQPTRAIVDAIKAASDKPKALIQQGGVDYYGSYSDDRLITLDSEPGDSFLAGVIKDKEAISREVEGMVRLVLARTGIVFDPAGGAFNNLLIPFKLFAGGPLGPGTQYYSWIHKDDEIKVLRWFVENSGARGAYIVAAPEAAQNKTIAKAIGRAMGRPSFMPAPAFALKIALGEVSDLVLKGQNARPTRLIEEGFEYDHPQIEEAVRDLLS